VKLRPFQHSNEREVCYKRCSPVVVEKSHCFTETNSEESEKTVGILSVAVAAWDT
jgi:hypothetical protein